MKVNPRTKYFIENLIPSSDLNPYFLWTEEDVSFFRFIIKETAVPSQKAELLEEYSQDDECFDPEKGQSGMWDRKRTASGKRIYNPYRASNPCDQLIRLKRKLTYNRKESGRDLIERTIRQCYPDFSHFCSVNNMAGAVKEIKYLKEKVMKGLESISLVEVGA